MIDPDVEFPPEIHLVRFDFMILEYRFKGLNDF